MSLNDKFGEIAEEAIAKAEKVDCSLEAFGEGLDTMIAVLQERRDLLNDELG